MANATDESLTPRHWIALTALMSGIVALYLHLWKLGLVGSLVCTASHGCEKAQYSQYGWFLGMDVALIGTIGYALILVTSLVGVQERWINDRRITTILMWLIIPAFLFTIRLKYAEFVILKTFCPWCAISAVTITLHLILVLVDRRRVARAAPSNV
ncbi:MAG TPA: vitamin K epoxide reductase family protein [Gemmatimonadales bacterium]|nr:vitamin K epoxide reductase family protein [Gemmatimonadales bacterium]